MPSSSSSDRALRFSLSAVYKAMLSLIVLACAAVFAARTWHWPLVGDAPLIHYIVFLIDRGWAPYRDIVDVNLPGAYFFESAVMHLMGGGALAWRIFDLLLGAAGAAAMIYIAWPWDRFAGFLAGALFMLLHGRDGIIELGERDLSMAVLVLAGYAFLFHAARAPRAQRRLWATALCGLCLGCAITVKPTALFVIPPLLALFALELRRRQRPWRSHLLAACAAVLVPLLLTLGYLLRERALSAFLAVLFRLIPAHAGLYHRSLGYLVAHSFAGMLPPLLLLWLPVALFGGLRRNWESAALLAGILFGLASFYAQGKGFPYHRYPAEAFLLLLVCIDLCRALSAPATPRSRWVRPLAVVALAALVAIAGVDSTRKALQFNGHDREFDTLLRADLTRLGGPSLNHHVQCMDMAAGCLNALYQMRLVQATGFLFDCYVLQPAPDDGGYRRRFWQEITADPPDVFVVSNSHCDSGPRDYSYSQLHDWPRFAAWLSSSYVLYASRIPPDPLDWSGHPGAPFGYRIYVRDGFHAEPRNRLPPNP